MPTVMSLSALARQRIKDGSPAGAIGLAEHILRHYPKAVEGCCLLGEAHAARGEDRKAGDYFALVLSADPENAVALSGLGVAYRSEGKLAEAVVQLERALELQPGSASLRRDVIGLRRLHGKALNDRIKPTRGVLGRIYLRSGLYARAVRELAAVFAAGPDRLDIAAGLAEALWRAELYGDAARVCNQILDMAPDCLKAKLLLADMGLAGEVRSDYQSLRSEAHGLDPDDRMVAVLFAGTAAAPRWPIVPAELPQPTAY